MALQVSNVSYDCAGTVSCDLTGGPPYPIHVYAQVYAAVQNPLPDNPPQDCGFYYSNGSGGNIQITDEMASWPMEGTYHAIVWAPSVTGYVKGDQQGTCGGP